MRTSIDVCKTLSLLLPILRTWNSCISHTFHTHTGAGTEVALGPLSGPQEQKQREGTCPSIKNLSQTLHGNKTQRELTGFVTMVNALILSATNHPVVVDPVACHMACE